MKSLLATSVIAIAALAVAFLQHQEVESLKGSLARSEVARQALEAQLAANAAQQQGVQVQIQQLQDSLRASSQQLLQLSSSLQEARDLLTPPVPQ